MRLRFIYMPVKDAKEALGFYRDTLGFDELWREGDATIGMKLPGSDVGLMLDEDPSETAPGPFFVVDDVRAFHRENASTIGFRGEPKRIPPGWYAVFDDPSGNVIRVMDDTESRENA